MWSIQFRTKGNRTVTNNDYSWSMKIFDMFVHMSELVIVIERVFSLEILYTCTWVIWLLPCSPLAWETKYFITPVISMIHTDTNTFYSQDKWRIILWLTSPVLRHAVQLRYALTAQRRIIHTYAYDYTHIHVWLYAHTRIVIRIHAYIRIYMRVWCVCYSGLKLFFVFHCWERERV